MDVFRWYKANIYISHPGHLDNVISKGDSQWVQTEESFNFVLNDPTCIILTSINQSQVNVKNME